jgi:hypothetical protein
MKQRLLPDLQNHLDGFFGVPSASLDADMGVSLLAASDDGIPVANSLPEIWAPAVSSPDAVSIDGQDGGIAVPSAASENVTYQIADSLPDGTAPEDTGGMATGTISPTPATIGSRVCGHDEPNAHHGARFR